MLYYDKGPINARLAWNSRTDWLASAADRSGNPVFRAGEDYLDARLQWRIKGDDQLSVFIEGKNLTDQAADGLRRRKVPPLGTGLARTPLLHRLALETDQTDHSQLTRPKKRAGSKPGALFFHSSMRATSFFGASTR